MIFSQATAADRCVVMGHRGSPRDRPENTLASFARAGEVGADAVELDARATRDGVIVVYHDPNLVALGLDIDVCDIDFDDLRNIDAGESFQGPDRDYPYRGDDLRIPTLAEALDLASDAAFSVNIEIKNMPHEPDFTATPEVALGAAAQVFERDMAGRVIFSSFNINDMSALKRAHPELRAAWITVGTASSKDLALVRDEGLDGLHPVFTSLGGDAVDETLEAAAEGDARLWIAPWTVNDSREIDRLVRAGVDAVITDVPAEAVEITEQHSRG